MRKAIIIILILIVISLACYFAYRKFNNSIEVTGIDYLKKQVDIVYKGSKNTISVNGLALQAGEASIELKEEPGNSVVGVLTPKTYLYISQGSLGQKIYLTDLKTGPLKI